MAFHHESDEVMASINITPLTDVLLVLLIIFMIAVSALQKERIKIPFTHYRGKAHETDLVILIQKDQATFVGAKEVALPKLQPYLEKLALELSRHQGGKLSDTVILKCDQDVPYGYVAKVMEAANGAGFHNISLATQPLEGFKKAQ